MLVLLLILFFIMLGHITTWAPASLLKAYIYRFKQMRVPSRLVECVALFLSAYAGIAVDRLPKLLGRVLPSVGARQAARTAVLAHCEAS